MDGAGFYPDKPLPRHIAVIMDGNGRWARLRGLPRTAGHRQGAEAVRHAVRGAGEFGVSYLTMFGFSSENWKRPAGEVDDLMGLLRRYLRSELAELHRHGVRLRVIGDRSRFSEDLVRLISDAEDATRSNDSLNLTLALNYGGRQEIAAAARRLGEQIALGQLRADDIDVERFAATLTTAGMPDPDVLIRTSGEKRVSNFLLWQCAYSEMVFLDKLWPDFGKDDLADAIREFQSRERRYGAAVGSR